MATTSFIRNELILGEKLWKETCSRRAKEQLYEIRDRMNQVIYEYDVSEEAYSKLDRRGSTIEEIRKTNRDRQQEILDHILEYKEACNERSSVLTALNFFFSSYCEPGSHEQDETPSDGESGYSSLYNPDFGNDFDSAYLSARSALEKLKFLNSQIVNLASQILYKKRGMDGSRSDWIDGTIDDLGCKTCCRTTLDAAQCEYERILEELEAKVALNSRLKKYVQNQEEAVEVCQSIARRLAVDNAHMLASLTASLKDVRTLTRELEKCAVMVDDLRDKYKLPPSECQITTDQDINARNLKSYRDLKKYETHVREIELDFSRLEHLSKLLDTMKLQLHQANKRKELTEEQFRGRIAKLRSDISDEAKLTKLNLRSREDNGELKKGKKRKKKKVKKSTKSSFGSTTTIGDCTESIVSEVDSVLLSPVSNLSEKMERCSPRKDYLERPQRMREKTLSNVSSDSVFLGVAHPRVFERSASRQLETEPFKQDVITALQSHSSPTITCNDPLFNGKHVRTNRASEAP